MNDSSTSNEVNVALLDAPRVLQPGDIVRIWQDPHSKHCSEGEARVVRPLRKVEGVGLEMCSVDFGDGWGPVTRFVDAADYIAGATRARKCTCDYDPDSCGIHGEDAVHKHA